MRIVFISNYLNHHQLPLCNAFLHMEDVEFSFIATEAVSQERLAVGYTNMDSKYGFVLKTYANAEEREKAIQKMKNATVLIYGVNIREFLSREDIKDKLLFLYTERSIRKIQFNVEFARIIFRMIKNHTLNRNKNMYVLCAGAYVADEFRRFRAHTGKMYRWGYFPEVIVKEREEALKLKVSKSIRILWVARLLKLKRPEQVLVLAKMLKEKGYDFKLDIIGCGELEDGIKKYIRDEGLKSYVNVLGNMPASEVRNHMDRANIFLFTSSREEGWGAVLNEAMSSRCAVVANRWIGSVPFLIQHGKNGLIYEDTVEDLLVKTESLMKDREKQLEFGEQAYRTMITLWNAEVAAGNFVQLSQRLLNGEKCINDMEGPCSFIG